jgi:alkylated DNA nucleotide flippase Atl1
MQKTGSWRSKLDDAKDLPKVVKIPPRMRARWGSGTLVIPAPLEVDSIMKRIPRGKLITINEIRAKLARKHGATIGCPITTGIFAWIAANAAKEAEDLGKKRVTPYWRTLKSGGEINPKYPGGIEVQSRLLAREGHTVIHRGSRAFVTNYTSRVVTDR